MEREIYDRIRVLEDSHWWFIARRRILSRLIGDLGVPADAKVLEVGCGTGGNLAMLARFGDVTGLEPDEESRVHAAAKAKVPVVGGLLPNGLDIAPASFDLVAALDVIEHIDDDAAAVAAIARLLKPGGLLVTTVPAYQWMWSGHDLAHHHKRRYRLSRYRRLFEDAGLEVRKASYFNTLLFPLIGSVRLAKKVLGIEGGDDEDSAVQRKLNGLFAAVFGFERHWLAHAAFPFGVSIFLAARRPG